MKSFFKSIGFFTIVSAVWMAPTMLKSTYGDTLRTPTKSAPLFTPGDAIVISDFKWAEKDADVTLSIGHPGSEETEKNETVWDFLLTIIDQLAIYRHDGTSGEAETYTNFTLKQFKEDHPIIINVKDPGAYVLVWHSPDFKNHFPIITHWQRHSAADNSGYFEEGASDGINQWDLNPTATGLLTGEGINHNKQFAKQNAQGQRNMMDLFYSADQNLFEYIDDAPLPFFENYAAENFSTTSISRNYAAWYSDTIRSATGFPVVFINSNSGDAALLRNAPVIQVVNNFIINKNDNPMLVTLMLPPNWSDDSKQHYPVIANSHYDINKLVYGSGINVAKIIGNVYNKTAQNPQIPDTSAIAVFANGGAASGPYGAHPSFLQNINTTFDLLSTFYAGDINNIITFGVSRSGNAALLIAGNATEERNYTVRYALANVTFPKLGDWIYNATVNTYPLLSDIYARSTGYAYSWMGTFEKHDPMPGNPEHMISGQELVIENWLGHTPDLQYINENHSPIALSNLQQLADDETNVWLMYGTHDGYLPTYMNMDYFNEAKKAGVNIKREIYLRGGHATFAFSNTYLKLENSLSTLIGMPSESPLNPNLFETADQTNRFLRDDPTVIGFNTIQQIVDAVHFTKDTEIENTPFPFAMEAPLAGVCNTPALITILGPPNKYVRLEIVPIDPIALRQGNIEELGAAIPLIEDAFLPALSNSDPAGGAYAFEKAILPEGEHAAQTYLYKLMYRDDPADDWILLEDYQMAQLNDGIAPRVPILSLLSKEPILTPDEMSHLAPWAIGFGLSQY